MATRLQYLCELCLDENQETDARPVYALVETKGAIVDLCPDHREQVLGPVETLIRDHGRPVESEQPKAKGVRKKPSVAAALSAVVPQGHAAIATSKGYYPCPSVECVNEPPWSTSYTLGRHTRDVHGVEMSDVYLTIGSCRVPDCRGLVGSSPQGIGSHLSSVHSIPNLATMLYQLALSDPATVEDVLAMFWNHGDPADGPDQGPDPVPPDTQGTLV